MKFSCFCPDLVSGSSRKEESETTRVLRLTSREAEERFIKNGGMVLEKLIGSWNGRCTPIRNFSAKELKQITNYNDPANFLSDAGAYKWYKGSIEGRIVSIKRYYHSKYHITNIHNQAINDIAIAAQMNTHNNILKLIGCCLEKLTPIPVFEFAENKTLYFHIHISGESPPAQPLLWKSRLRIATEIASAVIYLHTAFRTPIIHREIKSSNVFLDRHDVAKLSGFENSIAIPEGETHVEDQVFGTLGYIAPEYLRTGLVSENVDVYSFGVLLIELLTGRKPIIELAVDDVLSNEDIQILLRKKQKEDIQILDPTILEEVGQIDVQQQVRAMSELALRCTMENPEERPTMMNIARQLLHLKRTAVGH